MKSEGPGQCVICCAFVVNARPWLFPEKHILERCGEGWINKNRAYKSFSWLRRFFIITSNIMISMEVLYLTNCINHD